VSDVFVFGAGQLGRCLARGLRAAGVAVTLRAARRGWPRRLAAPLVVLAVRDGQIAGQAAALATATRLGPGVAVVHCAGALGVEALAALVGRAALGKMHPLVSVAGRSPSALAGGWVGVAGDRLAVRRARGVARALGMRPVDVSGVDPLLYHAAAVMVAGGGAALVAGASTLLASAGVPREQATAMLAPLLASTAANIRRLGLPRALTGPLRRGDRATVAAHLEQLARHAPAAIPLYVALAQAQLVLGRQLGEASLDDYDHIGASLARAGPPRRGGRSRRRSP
jgi:predicted short-subunit dehydrogenase-like oxidoreductase (DUF2520 family)